MKVLMLSGDPKTIVPGNETYARMRQYAEALGELKILALSGQTFVRRLCSLLSLWREGRALLKKTRYDVITVQAADEAGLIGHLLSREFKIPLQVQIHTDIFSPWYRRTSWKERIRFHLAKFLIPRASCIRAVSQRIADSLKSKVKSQKSKIAILPIFTDISKFLAAIPDPETEKRFHDYSFKMIAVGRLMNKEKNFSMLIDMMSDFIKVCPKALLVLVGEGPDRENYKLQIINYKLQRNVIIEKWRNDLPSFYKSFDLFLLPSNYEGWGRTVIEAMASGLPVLMTNVGLAGEAVMHEKQGLVVPVGDKKAFLDACVRLYTHSGQRKTLASSGQERVKELFLGTTENYLEKYRESFQRCL